MTTDFSKATLDCLRWAEGLIKQLPLSHDGRNSWLMNFGKGQETDDLRRIWEGRSGQAYPVKAPTQDLAVNAYGAGQADAVAWQVVEPGGLNGGIFYEDPLSDEDRARGLSSRPLYTDPPAASARIAELEAALVEADMLATAASVVTDAVQARDHSHRRLAASAAKYRQARSALAGGRT